MGLLDWEPGPRLAFWGKRVALGFLFVGVWTLEGFFVATVFESLAGTLRPAVQDWPVLLMYGSLWTGATILMAFMVRGEWPRRIRTK